MTRAPVRVAYATGRRTTARTLRRVKRVLRHRAPTTVLQRVGVDVDTRRGLVTRLEVPLTTNPWLTRAEWRLLASGAPDDVAVRIGGAP